MIFLTVGTQLPFDRLTSTVDAWCAEVGCGPKIFGQIGRLGAGSYRPQHFKWAEKVAPADFDRHFREASLIVSHAGMGSIITAMASSKPIVILPRRSHLQEQRNDHQFATAQRLGTRRGVFAAMTESDLPGLISRVIGQAIGKEVEAVSPFADAGLIKAVRDFIHVSGDT
jgi:UDP-N-acetylglucosamine transferase subunit ALG13